jgi:hypothetical protein
MLHGEGTKDPRDEHQAAQLGLSRDRRRTIGAVNERHLAEVVTGTKGPNGPSAHAHGRPPRYDDAKGYADFLFVGQYRASGKRPVVRLARAC